MNQTAITQIKDLLASPKNIVIVGHKNPDGDAMGAALGLYHYLSKHRHTAQVVMPNAFPDFLAWMPSSQKVIKYETQASQADVLIAQADIIFTLDFNALHRTGSMEPALKESRGVKIMIDHHQAPEDYAQYVFSDVRMSSTCEMIYRFIDYLDDMHLISEAIATCLYTGIMTDTGSFKFNSTTSETHRVAASLIDKGADNSQIQSRVFDSKDYGALQLLGCALCNLKVLPEYRAAYISLSQEELDEFHYKKGDTQGIVNYALSLKNVVLAAIFIENKQEAIIKISFRSIGDFSVNEFSRTHFNGGGHTNAAGGKSDTTLQETINKFIGLLPGYSELL